MQETLTMQEAAYGVFLDGVGRFVLRKAFKTWLESSDHDISDPTLCRRMQREGSRRIRKLSR